MKRFTIFLIFVLCFCSCASKQNLKKDFFKEVKKRNYPVFHDDMGYDGLLRAIDMSLSYYSAFNDNKEFSFGENKILKTKLEDSLTDFKIFIESNPCSKELENYISKNFRIYSPASKNKDKSFLFTGYYEPELKGSLKKTDKYIYPLYLLPKNIVYVELEKFSSSYGNKRLTARKEGNKIVPYFTNEEIAFEKVLEDEGEVIVWLDSQVDLFFLQIQGSGKVYLENGDVLRVHYAGTNGHGYKSIGKYLIDQNKMTLAEMSMQSLKKYLEENPGELRDILSYNKSYVFFEIVEGGPYGALSRELTPGRSIASDLKIYPRGALVYIETKKPVVSGNGEIKKWTDLKRFMLIQDTGGAIKGYFRGDIFFGCGEYAKTAAGHLANEGSIYILLPVKTKD